MKNRKPIYEHELGQFSLIPNKTNQFRYGPSSLSYQFAWCVLSSFFLFLSYCFYCRSISLDFQMQNVLRIGTITVQSNTKLKSNEQSIKFNKIFIEIINIIITFSSHHQVCEDNNWIASNRINISWWWGVLRSIHLHVTLLIDITAHIHAHMNTHTYFLAPATCRKNIDAT